MKIGFTSTPALPAYRTRYAMITDGEIADFTKTEAERLLETMPDNFRTVEAHKKFLADGAAVAEKESLDADAAGPRGDTQNESSGDTTGTNTDELTDDEKAIFDIAAKKVDEGDDLTEEEIAIMDKVEAAEAAAASEG